MANKTVMFQVRVDEDKASRFDEIAAQQSRSRANLLTIIIEEYLETQGKKVGV